jgi:hypothetical protein
VVEEAGNLQLEVWYASVTKREKKVLASVYAYCEKLVQKISQHKLTVSFLNGSPIANND